MPKKWIKLHVNKWLDGSTRNELTPGERSVWIDLLALAGRYDEEANSDGVVPIPKETLCRILHVHPTLFDRAIKKFIEHDKITIDEDVITIKNWRIYNPSRAEIWDAEHPSKAARRVADYKARHTPDTETTENSESLQNTTKHYPELELDKELERDNIIIVEEAKELERVLEECCQELTEDGMGSEVMSEERVKDISRVVSICGVGNVRWAVRQAARSEVRKWSYAVGALRKKGFDV